MGWHPLTYKTTVDESVINGVLWLTLTTSCRCKNPDCAKHLWWVFCDRESRPVATVTADNN